MKKYVLTLGKTPDLSLAELKALIGVDAVSDGVMLNRYQLVINSDSLDPEKLMSVSGGLVKIGQVIDKVRRKEVKDCLVQVVTEKRIALSSPNMKYNDLDGLAGRVKKGLDSKGIKTSYRILKDIFESAGLKNKYQEYQLIEEGNSFLVIRTVAVQDIDKFSKKDYKRPNIDKKSGMLPPKISRIMINLANSNDETADLWMYDPFCGSGTILMEGLDLGMSVLGSDLSQKAVDDSNRNCEWVKQEFNLEGEYMVWKQDATQIQGDQFEEQVGDVVFEGYLGPQQINRAKILDMTKGMIKMYKGVLKKLGMIQQSGSTMVCALPEFDLKRSVKMFDNLIDSCEKYGYTSSADPLTYGRSKAKVKRRIYQLHKK